ncbi:MAG: tripartite tricarboxylate transporter substrate binding protein [Betaproteobacteria bacterium]
MKVTRAIGSGFLVALVLATAAVAQGYPAKPVKVLVPFAPGGTADIVARLVSSKLSEELGQQFVIENRGGAGGTIATAMAAKASPDGYTVLAAHQGVAFNVTLYTKLPFDTVKELMPLAMIGPTPNVLVVNNSFAPRTVPEFLAYARANPGAIAYGSGGVGSAGHLSVELLEGLTRTRLTHVPYKGSGPALADLVSGQIQAMILTLPAAVSYIKSGKVKAIATSGAKRSPAMADLPTLAEGGVTGYEYAPWYGWFIPAGTPRPVVERLHQAINKVISAPGLRDQFIGLGLEPEPMSQERFAEIFAADITRWGGIIRGLGLKAD